MYRSLIYLIITTFVIFLSGTFGMSITSWLVFMFLIWVISAILKFISSIANILSTWFYTIMTQSLYNAFNILFNYDKLTVSQLAVALFDIYIMPMLTKYHPVLENHIQRVDLHIDLFIEEYFEGWLDKLYSFFSIIKNFFNIIKGIPFYIFKVILSFVVWFGTFLIRVSAYHHDWRENYARNIIDIILKNTAEEYVAFAKYQIERWIVIYIINKFASLSVYPLIFAYKLVSYVDYIIITFLVVFCIFLNNNISWISAFIIPEIILLISIFIVTVYYIYILFKSYIYKSLEKHKYAVSDAYYDSINFSVVPLSTYLSRLLLLGGFCMLLLYMYIFYILSLIPVGELGVTQLYCFGTMFVSPLYLVIKIFIVIFYMLVVYSMTSKNTFIRVEFVLILSFSLFFSLILLSSYNLMLFYISLECFTLCCTVLVFISVKNDSCIESTLIYFFVNSIASLLILLGISLIYGYHSTLSFKSLSVASIILPESYCFSFNIGFALTVFIIGVCIKLAIIPLNMWVFNVYDNVPFSFVVYLLSVNKVLLFTSLFYLCNYVFSCYFFITSKLIMLIFLLAMPTSTILALNQFSFRKFIIASSMVNSSLLFLGLLSTSTGGTSAFFSFLLFDNLFLLAFALLVYLIVSSNSNYENALFDLGCISRLDNIMVKFILSLYIFAISGIPPFGVFLLKYEILLHSFSSGSWFLSAVALLFSSLSFYYYSRIIKVTLFSNNDKTPNYLNYSSKNDITYINIFVYIFILNICLFLPLDFEWFSSNFIWLSNLFSIELSTFVNELPSF